MCSLKRNAKIGHIYKTRHRPIETLPVAKWLYQSCCYLALAPLSPYASDLVRSPRFGVTLHQSSITSKLTLKQLPVTGPSTAIDPVSVLGNCWPMKGRFCITACSLLVALKSLGNVYNRLFYTRSSWAVVIIIGK